VAIIASGSLTILHARGSNGALPPSLHVRTCPLFSQFFEP
jgi:hypothetical protein